MALMSYKTKMNKFKLVKQNHIQDTSKKKYYHHIKM